MNHISELRAVMKKRGVDYYLVKSADPHLSEYICDHDKTAEFYSGFTGDNATLLVAQEEAFLWTDGRYFTQAETELKDSGIELMRLGEKDVPTLLDTLLRCVDKGDTVMALGESFSYGGLSQVFELCALKKARFIYEDSLTKEVWNNRPARTAGRITYLPLSLAGKSVEAKLKKVRAELLDTADAMFVSSLDDIMWLFNLRGEDIACSPVAFSYAVVTAKKAVVFLQKASVNKMLRNYAEGSGFEIRDYDSALKYIKKNFGKKHKIMLDMKAVNFAQGQEIKKLAGEIVDRQLPTALLKAKKNKTEIKNIRECFLQDSVAVTRFLYYIDQEADIENETETGLAAYLEQKRTELNGYRGPSFPTIAAYGANAAMAHYAPDTEKPVRLKKEGLFLCDAGGQYEGATTDMTRTIALGDVDKEIKESYTLVLAGFLRLMNAVWISGCSGRNLDILARERLWKAGLNFNHGTGHGVGCMLNVHEGPQAIRYKPTEAYLDAPLLPGMLITDEPGVYEPFKYGIRIENTLLVVKDKENEYGQFLRFEPLTLVPVDKKAINIKLLTKEEKMLLNQYHALVYEKIAPYLNEKEKDWLLTATEKI